MDDNKKVQFYGGGWTSFIFAVVKEERACYESN